MTTLHSAALAKPSQSSSKYQWGWTWWHGKFHPLLLSPTGLMAPFSHSYKSGGKALKLAKALKLSATDAHPKPSYLPYGLASTKWQAKKGWKQLPYYPELEAQLDEFFANKGLKK